MIIPKPSDFGLPEDSRLQSICRGLVSSFMGRAGSRQAIYMDRLKAVVIQSVTMSGLPVIVVDAVTTKGHKVFLTDQSWHGCSCTCPDFFFQRTRSAGACKHMAAVALKFLEAGP